MCLPNPNRGSTTFAPLPTSATGDVRKSSVAEEPQSSPYFPDIPDIVAQGSTEDTSKNYDLKTGRFRSTS